MTDLAALNLSTPIVSYYQSLPLIYSMFIGVFVNPSVYYTATFYYYFHKDYTNSEYLNSGKNVGIVHTSDISLS